ncbi:hypothetical protein NDU88_006627 [Pleurodeles waltl]|uniref:Uncharacterized protein n=1 Tax=Pleurodeles waltl TaxID=8319 RepID=A0AAV7QPK1_PLEWA|nr:hypothetical protein NDU88_006627 [Pleurodeles waltl]
MDQRVIRAMELLREAGRHDLIAAPAAARERPVRRAAGGVAAAVAACSPPRGSQQVSGAGRGRSGRLALACKGRAAGGARRQPRPLGARRPRENGNGGVGGGAGNPSASLLRQQKGRRPNSSGARTEGVRSAARPGGADMSGWQAKGRVSKRKGNKSLPFAGSKDNGIAVGVGGCESEEGAVRELSHILEWSDEAEQGEEEDKEQAVEDDGITLRVHPPTRTYGGLAKVVGILGVINRGDSVSEEVGRERGPEDGSKTKGLDDSNLSDVDVEILPGVTCGSEDGDPGELLTGSEPWEEEVTAGPSTASWTGHRRGGEAVRAKKVVTRYHTGSGFAPPSGRVSKGKRPGYASQREGPKAALRRPRIPAVQLEDIIKKARFGSGTRDPDSEELESGDSLDFDEDSVEEGEIRDEEVRRGGFYVLSLGTGAGGDRERAHDRRERMGRKEDKTNADWIRVDSSRDT